MISTPYEDLLRDVLENGAEKGDRTGTGTRSLFGKQIRYADRRGIPFVWFGPREDGAPHSVKDIRSGEQVPADPASWMPPTEDLRPSVGAPVSSGD